MNKKGILEGSILKNPPIMHVIKCFFNPSALPFLLENFHVSVAIHRPMVAQYSIGQTLKAEVGGKERGLQSEGLQCMALQTKSSKVLHRCSSPLRYSHP